jgi:hypothetical protein
MVSMSKGRLEAFSEGVLEAEPRLEAGVLLLRQWSLTRD